MRRGSSSLFLMPCLKGRIKSLKWLILPVLSSYLFYPSLRKSRLVMLSNLPQRVTCRFSSNLFLRQSFSPFLTIHHSCSCCKARCSTSAFTPLSCNWVKITTSNCFRTQTPLCMRGSMNILSCVLAICPSGEGAKKKSHFALIYFSHKIRLLEKAGIIFLIHVQSFFKRHNRFSKRHNVNM